MRLVLSRPAARDLEDIVSSIVLDDPRAAEGVHAAIVEAARGLMTSPAMGRAGQIHETRELPVASTPYRILYRADANELTILAIFHRANDVATAFRERGD